MPVIQQSRSSNNDQLYRTLVDWMRRIMQIAGPVSGVLLAFLLYHLIFGIVPRWSQSGAASPTEALAVINGAIFWLNVAVCTLLLTISGLYWAEECFAEQSVGIAMAITGVALYFGVPVLFEFFATGQTDAWTQSRNLAALSIYNELRILGLIAAVPGVLLTIRDIVCRCVSAGRVDRAAQVAMPFGGAVAAEEPEQRALLGATAKCWQLPFCRSSIRGACPIFLARKRCWRERVGCMCEEQVVRTMFEPMVRKSEIGRESSGLILAPADAAEETEEIAPWQRSVEAQPKQVARGGGHSGPIRIPRNTTLSDYAKRERCRNCIIYNEHQRLKYQLLSPFVVLLGPAVGYVYFQWLTDWFGSVLVRMDQVMAKLSLDATIRDVGFATAIPAAAQYVLVGCLITLGVTMLLRMLEYCMFQLKI